MAGGISPALDLPFSTYSTLADLTAKGVTFSRPSLATMIDSTGKLTYCPNQTFLNSADFSQASWVKSTCTVSGTGSITLSAGTIQKFVGSTGGPTSTTAIIVWFDVLAGTHSYFQILNSGDGAAYANFDASTGIVGTKGAKADSGVVTIGSGVYRLWAKFTTTSLSGINRIYAVDSSSATYAQATSSTGTFTLSGSGQSAVTYETSPRTVDQVVTTASAYYGPRFGYDPVTLAARGLLVEEARTNQVLNCNDLTNVSWTKRGTAGSATKDQTGPDGVSNSACRVSVAAAGVNDFYEAAYTTVSRFTNSASVAPSFYIKRVSTSGTLKLANAVTSVNGDWSINLALLSDNWERITSSHAAVTVNNAWVASAGGAAGILISASSSTSLTFDFYGAQLETGAFSTSLNLTGSAAVARSASAVSETDLTGVYNGSGGTEYIKFTTSTVSGTRTIIGINDGTTNNYMRLYTSGTDLKFDVVSGGVTQASLTLGTVAANTTYRAAFSYAANNIRAVMNGGSVQSDVSATVPTVTKRQYGVGAGTNYFNGWLNTHKAYTSALNDNQMLALVA